MWPYIIKIAVTAVVVVAVSEMAKRSPVWAALLASLSLHVASRLCPPFPRAFFGLFCHRRCFSLCCLYCFVPVGHSGAAWHQPARSRSAPISGWSGLLVALAFMSRRLPL